MRCQHCGKRIQKQQSVCPWCGQSQTDTEKQPELVRLGAKGATKRRRLTDKQKKWLIGIAISIGAVLLALVVTVVSLVGSMLGQINRESELDHSDIDINNALPDTADVQNIALFGLDTRSDNDNGRSDAIIILSIDRVHGKIKLTSLARDSLVAIEGHGESKITHAFGWGKAKLAVKTINQNFGMNISDYVYINFYEFAEIIDYIGGVMIDVNTAEAGVMNNHYGPELLRLGFDYKTVSAGYQRLSGPQALAYSRNRYTGSDLDRGNRQKEVLEAMFAQVKDTPLTKYPSVISQILSMCHTTLTNSELLSIATWAVGATPVFEQYTLPSAECHAIGGSYLHHGWVWRYDMDLATKVLHTYIYEDALDASATVATTSRTTVQKTTATTTTTAAPTTTTTASTPALSTTSTTGSLTTTTTTTTAVSTTDTTTVTTITTTDTTTATDSTTTVSVTQDTTVASDTTAGDVQPPTTTQATEATTAAVA